MSMEIYDSTAKYKLKYSKTVRPALFCATPFALLVFYVTADRRFANHLSGTFDNKSTNEILQLQLENFG